MRILVSNAFHMTAYPLVHALRDRVDFVAVAHMGDEPTDVARSRLVDIAYPLSLPRLVPKSTVLEEGVNSAMEQAFVDEALRICDLHRIDTVIPTSDHEVLVLAKNLAAFANRGVTCAAPCLSGLVQLLDKRSAVDVAMAAGLPVPRTIDVDATSLPDAVSDLGLPVMVKARFSFGGFGVKRAESLDEAVDLHRQLTAWSGTPFLQEFVPGVHEPSVNVLAGQNGTLTSFVLHKRRHLHTSMSTCVVVGARLDEQGAVEEAVRSSGTLGFTAVQLKLDERDGRHRLVEFNPRLGANFRIVSAMAAAAGVDLAGDMIRAFGGHLAALDGANQLPVGQSGISVLEDLLSIRTYLRASRAGVPDLPSRRAWLTRLGRDHLSRSMVRDIFWQERWHDRSAVLSSYIRLRHELVAGDPYLVPFGDWDRT